MGEFRGTEVYEALVDVLRSLTEEEVLIVDFAGATILDYSFTTHAIAPLFARHDEYRSRLLFCLDDSHHAPFFYGIVRALHGNCSYNDAQDAFEKNGHYCKILPSNATTIQFVGHLSHNEGRMLDCINSSRIADSSDLPDRASLSPEDATDALRSLVRIGFVLSRQADEGDHTTYIYYSYESLDTSMIGAIDDGASSGN
jgi:hypothetical protein